MNPRIIEIDGEKKCIRDWCRVYDRNFCTYYERLARGWDWERALKEPVKESRKRHNGNANQ